MSRMSKWPTLLGVQPFLRSLLLAGAVAGVLAGCGPTADLEQVHSLQKSGQFEATLEPLQQLLEARPDDPELLYLYGLALVRTGQSNRVSWALTEAMEDTEWLAQAGLLLASVALSSQNHATAREAMDRVLESQPDNSEALLLRAHARIASRKDYAGALADADRVIELDPDRREALVPRAVALLGLGRIDEAAVVLEEIEGQHRELGLDVDSSARFCAVRAVFAKEKGETEKAKERFGACLDEFPSHSETVSSAIEFYDEIGDRERPIEVLRLALESQPLMVRYRGALASRLRSARRAKEAEQVLLDAVDLYESSPEVAWVELSRHYQAVEDYARMASALERALAVAAGPTPDIEFALADGLILAGRYEEALVFSREMSLPAQRSLVEGMVHYYQGRPREALDHLTEGLRLWPNNAGARYYAAAAAEQLGDFDRAIEEYRYSIRADSQATDARYRLALLHEAEGAFDLVIGAAGAGRRGSDVEADLVALRVSAKVGLASSVQRLLAQIPDEGALGTRAVVAIAEGMNYRQGPSAAVRLLLEIKGIDLQDPGKAELLRALVVYMGAAGESERATPLVAGALTARPDTAAFHGIQGLLLEQGGAAPSEIRSAYERALELDPQQADALLGLARLEAAEGDPEAGLLLLARAVEAQPEAAPPLRARAELLASMSRSAEAERELERLLEEHPYSGAEAGELAELRRARGAFDARTVELEQRAKRFSKIVGATTTRPDVPASGT